MTTNQEPTKTPATSQQPAASNTLSIVSMVLGIVAVVSTFIGGGFLFIPSIVLGIAAVITGIVAIVKKFKKGPAIAGIVTGSAAFIFSVVILTFFFGFLALWGFQAEQHHEQERRDRIENQQAADALQKNFAKGETAHFGDIELKVLSTKEDTGPTDETSYIIYTVEMKNISNTRTWVDPSDFEFMSNSRVVPLAKSGPNSFERVQLQAGETIQTEFALSKSEYGEPVRLQYETRLGTAGATFTLVL